MERSTMMLCLAGIHQVLLWGVAESPILPNVASHHVEMLFGS
jgi:hypothetical protein